jgi:spermidine synthase
MWVLPNPTTILELTYLYELYEVYEMYEMYERIFFRVVLVYFVMCVTYNTQYSSRIWLNVEKIDNFQKLKNYQARKRWLDLRRVSMRLLSKQCQ